MVERISSLTWRHPKLVLAGIGAFMIAAAIFGRGVEEHLKAAGFTDSASESERSTELLRDELGYDANPGLVVLVRDEDGKPLDITAPAVRKEVHGLADSHGDVDFVGKAVDPLRPLERAEDEIRQKQRGEIATARRAYKAEVSALRAQFAAQYGPTVRAPAIVPFEPP